MAKSKVDPDQEAEPEVVDFAKWLDIEQVAEIFDTSVGTIKRWVHEGLLHPQEHKRNGKPQWLFDPADVKNCAKARAEGEGSGFVGRNAIAKFEGGLVPSGDQGQPMQAYFKGQTEFQSVINQQGRMIRDQHSHIQELHEQGIAINKLLTDHLLKSETRAENMEKERLKFFRSLEEMASEKHKRDMETMKVEKRMALMDTIAQRLMFGLDRAIPGFLKKLGVPTDQATSQGNNSQPGSTGQETSQEDNGDLAGAKGLIWFLDNALLAGQYAKLRGLLGQDVKPLDQCRTALERGQDGEPQLRELAARLRASPGRLSEIVTVLSAEQMDGLQKLLAPYLTE